MAFQPKELSLGTVKGFVDRLHKHHKTQPAPTQWPPKRTQVQEEIAAALGFPNWHALHQSLSQARGAEEASFPISVQLLASPPGSLFNWVVEPGNFKQLQLESGSHLLILGRGGERAKTLSALNQSWPGSVLQVTGAQGESQKGPLPQLDARKGEHFDALLNDLIKNASMSDTLGWLSGFAGLSAHQMWQGRAMSLLTGVVGALVHLRNYHRENLSVERVRHFLCLAHLQTLVGDSRLPLDVAQPLKSYLRSLPGFDDNAREQKETVLEQHGYLQMLFRFPIPYLERAEKIVPIEQRRLQLLLEDNCFGPGFGEAAAAWLEKWLGEHGGPKLLILDGLSAGSPLWEWAKAQAKVGRRKDTVCVVATDPSTYWREDPVLTVAANTRYKVALPEADLTFEQVQALRLVLK